jgi:hypothetical protein
MTLRIERSSGAGKTILRVSGRISLEYLDDLRSQTQGLGPGTVLDLEHVTLVDVEGVGFLSECEAKGIELLHCSPYIREWITRERQR